MIEVNRWISNQVNYAMYVSGVRTPAAVFVTNERDALRENTLPLATIKISPLSEETAKFGGFRESAVITIWFPEGTDPQMLETVSKNLDRQLAAARGETDNYFFTVFKVSSTEEVFHRELKSRGVRAEFVVRGFRKP